MEPKGRDDEHIFDYSKITENIYIGSDFCKGGVCLIHGEEFHALGISIELNLSQEANELPPKDIETYIWIPVVDGYAPSQAQLDIGTTSINSALENGKKVYIHCGNGHGRSPTMVAAYLVRYKKMNVAQSLKFISEKRPEVHIEVTQKKALEIFANRK